jgi:hypothetical protein
MIKRGDKGENVKQLQIFLGIPADGDFGPMTEKAVKEWQSKNNLSDDGIVGPKTLRAMGLIDTHINEEKEDLGDDTIRHGELVINQAFMPKDEYFPGPTKKSWFFLHHTAGWNNPYKTIRNWSNDKRGAVATEFCIGGQKITNNDAQFDGEVVQAFPEGGYGWHLAVGRRPVHTHSVGVEVNCFGQLTQGGYYKRSSHGKMWISKDPDKFYTYVGTEAHPDQVFDLGRKFRGHQYWHNYTDAQIESLRKLTLYIAERDNIDVTKGLPELIKEKGAFEAFDFRDTDYVENHPGLWTHTNVRKGKVDMYPHPKLVEMLLSL